MELREPQNQHYLCSDPLFYLGNFSIVYITHGNIRAYHCQILKLTGLRVTSELKLSFSAVLVKGTKVLRHMGNALQYASPCHSSIFFSDTKHSLVRRSLLN